MSVSFGSGSCILVFTLGDVIGFHSTLGIGCIFVFTLGDGIGFRSTLGIGLSTLGVGTVIELSAVGFGKWVGFGPF